MMAYCKDCLHYEVCKHHEAVVDFEVSDGVCRFFAPDTNVGRKWIPVTERLPDSERWVLAWYKNLNMPGGRAEKAIYMCDDYDPYWRPLERDITEVTHWMPLPQPPKEE